jgi:predicted nucleic acid-binding protein
MPKPPNRFDKQDIAKLSGKAVMFDANIILFLSWSLKPGSMAVRVYSGIFGLLIKQGNNLIINTIVLSEVINRVARLEYQKYCDITPTPLDYKQYRNSTAGQLVFQDIYNILNTIILPHFNLGNKTFNVDEIKGMLKLDDYDFNDKLIIAECKEKNYLLFTDDGDFINADVDILTANHKLLTV